MLSDQPVYDINFGMLASGDDAEGPAPHLHIQVLDKVSDLIQSPQAVSDFTKHLAAAEQVAQVGAGEAKEVGSRCCVMRRITIEAV